MPWSVRTDSLNFWYALLLITLATGLAGGGCAPPPQEPLRRDWPTEPLQLPRDLAAHPWAQTEWWYYTGHLTDDQGDRYGFELTFFRRRFDDDSVGVFAMGGLFVRTGFVGHFAVVNEQTGEYLTALVRKPEGSAATAATDRYAVTIQDWTVSGDSSSHHLQAQMDGAAIDLDLEPLKPAVLHGENGITPKGNGLANYYFSYPRMSVRGTLTLHGRELPVQGMAWFDHEFGYMGTFDTGGWDWFSIQLEDDTEIMIYAIRNGKGEVIEESRACRVDVSGAETCIPVTELQVEVLSRWVSPDTGAVYPAGWHLQVERWGVDLLVIPRVADQEFHEGRLPYWEGSCLVLGRPADGTAYVELVGYAPRK